MQTTRRLATAAVRRWFLRELLVRLGPWLSVGLGVGLGLALADRLFGPGLPGWLLVAPPALAGIAMAVAGAWRARRAPVSALGEVDIAMGLRDRLSSAYALSETAPDDPFVVYAADDAERAAGGVRLRQAMPIRLGESWWVWPVLGAMAVATAMFMPVMRIGWDTEAIAEAEERQREVTEASRQLEETKEKIEQRLADAFGDPRRDEKLQRLEDIRRQLEEGASDPDSARSSAAGALDELATELERDAEDGERRFDALSERFSGLDRPRPDSPASPLADALRRGDEQAAREAIEQMQRELELMDEEERRRLAEELERLAERLEQESDRAQREREQSRERLLDQGMTQEEAEDLLDETDRDAIRDALREQGMDEETAERMADRLAEQNRRRQAEERAEQDARDMADALRDAADEMREEEPPPPEPEPEPTTPDDEPRRPEEPAEEPDDAERQPDEAEGAEERPGDDAGEGDSGERDPSRTEPSDEPGEEPSERPAPDPDGDEGEERTEERSEERGEEESRERSEEGAEEGAEERPEERPDEREGQRSDPGEPGERTEEAEREAEAGEEDADAEERPAPGESPGDEEAQRSGEEGDAEGEGREEGAREGEADGEAEGEAGADGEPGARESSGRGLDRVRDKIEELERERDRLNRQREDAQGVREEAQRLMDDMSPEEQERARRWGEQMARERGDRPDPAARPRDREADRLETVDLRRPDGPADDERVIAEWFSDEEAPEGGPVSRRDPGEMLREAAEAAERAVEDQPLHPRYRDLIRRYYRRLPELTPPAPAPESDGG